jgi:hypothetical protein
MCCRPEAPGAVSRVRRRAGPVNAPRTGANPAGDAATAWPEISGLPFAPPSARGVTEGRASQPPEEVQVDAVGVLESERPGAPVLIGRSGTDLDPARPQLCVQYVGIVHRERDVIDAGRIAEQAQSALVAWLAALASPEYEQLGGSQAQGHSPVVLRQHRGTQLLVELDRSAQIGDACPDVVDPLDVPGSHLCEGSGRAAGLHPASRKRARDG